MNAALAYGADELRAQGFGTVLACVGDLPALRPASVARVLQVSGRFSRAFLADASGVGTTMLVAHDAPLAPDFQGRSAARHRAGGAVPLTEEGARRAVGRRPPRRGHRGGPGPAVGLGVGPSTAALLTPDGQLGDYQVVTATDWTDDHGRSLAVTAAGRRVVLPDEVVADQRHRVRSGQRLHAVTAAGRVLSAWW